MKQLLLIGLGLLSLGSAFQKEINAEDAIGTAKQFIKDNGIQGKFTLSSCNRLKYEGRPGGFVWHVYMVRDASQQYSIGITSLGKLIWMEPSEGRLQNVPKVDAKWQQKALQKASGMMEKLHSPWTIAKPDDDLVRFADTNFFFPIAVNGKRFVGTNLGYQFQLQEDFQLKRFIRNDEVPPVNTAEPTVEPAKAAAEAKASLEEEAKGQSFLKNYTFNFGKESLVYYYQPNMKEARLCWYFKVDAEYKYDFSSRGGKFGVVVDAVTGKRIKPPTMLS